MVGEVLGALDREAAVDVDGALRPAGRARRVDEHVRRLGVGRRRRPAAASASSPRHSASSHHASRPRVHGVATAVARAPDDEHPREPTARRATASSAMAFSGTHAPRRRNPSAVTSTRRLAVGETGRDRRGGVAARRSACRSRRSRPSARTVTTVSTSIGRKIPTRSPGRRRAPAGVARPPRPPPPARRSSGAGRRRPRPPRRVPRRPGRARRAARSPRARSRTRRRSTSAPRPGRRLASSTSLGGRCQAMPRSSAAAPQNQPGIGDRAGLQRLERRLAGRPQEPRPDATPRPQLRRRAPRDVLGVAAEDRPAGVPLAAHARTWSSQRWAGS